MLVRLNRLFIVCLAFTLLVRGPLSAQEPPAVIAPANVAQVALLAEAPLSDFGMPRLAWTADGGLAVGMFDGMYESTGSVKFMPAWRGMGTALETLSGIEADGVYDIAANPARAQLAVGTRSGVIIYDLTTRTTEARIGDAAGALSLTYSPDGTLLAFRNTDNAVQLWDMRTMTMVSQLADVRANAGLAFAPDGVTLAVGDMNGDVYQWNVTTQQGAWKRVPDDEVHHGGGGSLDESIAYSPDGRYLTSTSFWEFGSVRLWDVATGQAIAWLEPLPDVAESMLFDANAFSPAGDLVAITGGPNNSTRDGVYLWSVADAADTAQGQPTKNDYLAQLPHHAVSSVAFSPDGTLIASASGGMLRLWSLDVPAQAALAETHPANVVAYCAALGETPAVSAGQRAGIVWSWYATTPELLADHVSSAQYDVLLDGQPLDGWRHMSQPQPDPANDGNWTIYYYVDAPALAPGAHEIEYRLTWRYAISDGLADFGPDTTAPEDSGRCNFEVG